MLNAKYKKKWENIKKEIFLSLQKEEYEKAYELLDTAKSDIDFNVVPLIPEDAKGNLAPQGSPANELLILLAHPKIFFTQPEPTEVVLEKVKQNADFSKMTDKEIAFIDKLTTIINIEKSAKLLEDPTDQTPINIPDSFPHFRVERTEPLKFIDKLIEYGADPHEFVVGKGSYIKKIIGVDSSVATKHALDIATDEDLTTLYRDGDLLCESLNTRAENSFNLILKEKGHLFDLKKPYQLLGNNTILHIAMAQWMPNEAEKLIAKNVSLTLRNSEGNLPVDLVPNAEIARAMEDDKNIIRANDLILTSEISKAIMPSNFKPHKALPETSDEYYDITAKLTKYLLDKSKAKDYTKKYHPHF